MHKSKSSFMHCLPLLNGCGCCCCSGYDQVATDVRDVVRDTRLVVVVVVVVEVVFFGDFDLLNLLRILFASEVLLVGAGPVGDDLVVMVLHVLLRLVLLSDKDGPMGSLFFVAALE